MNIKTILAKLLAIFVLIVFPIFVVSIWLEDLEGTLSQAYYEAKELWVDVFWDLPK